MSDLPDNFGDTAELDRLGILIEDAKDKRIAELEAENTEVQQRIDDLVQTVNVKNTEIEKLREGLREIARDNPHSEEEWITTSEWWKGYYWARRSDVAIAKKLLEGK